MCYNDKNKFLLSLYRSRIYKTRKGMPQMGMHPIIAQYSKLVPFLGAVLGPDYEIALQDLTQGNYCIVAIANGFNSGREVGAPLTTKALGFVESKIYQTQDAILGYRGVTPKNAPTNSSTMFIKDDDGTLLGMLCINYNMERCTQTLQKVLELCNLPVEAISSTNIHPQHPAEVAGTEQPEIFSGSVEDLIDSILERNLESGITPERLNQAEKIQIINKLKECGVFSVKGAVREVAAKLHCSEPTIYRYLKNT